MKRQRGIERAGTWLAMLTCLGYLGSTQAGTNSVTADYFQAVDASNTNYFQGNTGIGTSSPSEKLHVAGGAKVDGVLTVDGAMQVARSGDIGMGDFVNGGANQGTIVTNGLNNIPRGYISGCWPSYVDTDTVSIGVGDGYCFDKYFAQTSAVNVDVTSFSADAWDWHYIYLDYDASTFPNSLVFYTATNEPAKSVAQSGWYHASASQDRLIAAVIQTNSTAALLPFMQRGMGEVYFLKDAGGRTTSGFQLCNDQNPSGYFDTPATAESSTYLPVCAKQALICLYGYRAGIFDSAVASYEESQASYVTSLGKDVIPYRLGERFGAYDNMVFRWVTLGASRNVRVAQTDASGNYMSAGLMAFTIER